MVTMRLASDKVIKATANHKMVVIVDGKQVLKRADQVRAQDVFLVQGSDSCIFEDEVKEV